MERERPKEDAGEHLTDAARALPEDGGGDAAHADEVEHEGEDAGHDAGETPTTPQDHGFYDPPLLEEQGTGERELDATFVPEDPSMPGLATTLARAEALGAATRIGFLNQHPTRPETVFKLHIELTADDVITTPGNGSQYALIASGGRRILVISGSTPPPTGVDSDLTIRTTATDLTGLELVLAYLKEPNAEGAQLSLGLLEVQEPGTGVVLGSDRFAPVPVSEELSCVEQALLNLDLPDLDFNVPPIYGCGKERCVQVAEAWLLAHYSIYRVRQMLEYMAGHSAQKRTAMWSSHPTSKEGGALLPSDPPDLYTKYRFADWFGGYENYRFDAIRRTYNRLWNRFREARVARTNLRLICPDQSENPGNVCFTAHPHAHHAVIGYVNLCSTYFSKFDRPRDRTHILMHEILHHMWVEWKDPTWKAYVLTDTHTHGHGNACVATLKTETMYYESALHLASYHSNNGNTCWHRNYALRNPDNYANFAANIGLAVYDGKAVSWPHPPPAPPQTQGPNPCDENAPLPNPGPPFQPSANSCQKIGGELICPHPGTDDGAVEHMNATELFPVCP